MSRPDYVVNPFRLAPRMPPCLPAPQHTPVDSLRVTRKEQLLELACRVQAEYGFRMSSKDRVPRTRDEFSFATSSSSSSSSGATSDECVS